MNRLLSRPVIALSRTSVRNSGHVMNDETIMHWKKISFFFCPVFLCIGYLNKDVRTPEHMIRPAWSQSPWCNMTTAKLPWSDGSHAAFFWTQNLKKLISHAEIPERDECIIRNMTKLNIQIFSEANKNVRKVQVAKKDRSADVKYQLSRFTPAVKDIMEYAIDGKLDDKAFQFLSGTRPMVSSGGVRSSTFGGIFEKVGDFFDGSDDEEDESARYHWHKKDGDKSESKAGPRLIIFVLGGITSSEMRCAYEVTKNYVPQKAGNRGNKNATEKWEVLIGSTHICKPHEHLLQVRSISEPNTNNNSSHVNRAFEAD